MGEMADDYDWFDPSLLYTTCKYCGTDYLIWEENEDGKFRLFTEEGNIHSCKKYSIDKTKGL